MLFPHEGELQRYHLRPGRGQDKNCMLTTPSKAFALDFPPPPTRNKHPVAVWHLDSAGKTKAAGKGCPGSPERAGLGSLAQAH